jgi:iron(III) transport system permease protein
MSVLEWVGGGRGRVASPPGRWALPRWPWLLVIALGIVTTAPLVALIWGSFLVPNGAGGERYGLDAWLTAFTKRNVTSAIWNTITLGLASQVIALPIAVLTAWLLGRTDLPGRRWLELGFWVSFFLPVLAVLQGWILLLDPHYGLINDGLGALLGAWAPRLDVYSWWGIVFAHLITNTISAKVMIMTPVFLALDSRMEEAATMAGDSPLQTLWRITLPLTLPIILATAMIGLINTLESFEIELILGIPQNIMVYSTLIYDMMGDDPPDFATASVLGIAIIVFLTALAGGSTLIARTDDQAAQGRFVTVSSHSRTTPIALGRWKYPAFALVSLIVLLLTVVPIGFLVASSLMSVFGFFNLPKTWTLRHWEHVLSDSVFLQSLGNTLMLAVLASVLAIVISTAVSYAIVRSPGAARRSLNLLSWIPSAMPGVLLSLGMLWVILSNRFLSMFYGSTISLAIVVAIGALTFSVQLLKNSIAQIGPEMEEAAWIGGFGRWRALFSIIVPLSIRAITVVGVVAFIAAARSIGQLSLLVTSNNRPLALLQLEYMSQGTYEPSAVVGVMVVGMALCAALIVRRLSRPRHA